MTSMNVRKNLRRAFGCWPSRIGATALIALTASWAMESYAGAAGAVGQTIAAID